MMQINLPDQGVKALILPSDHPETIDLPSGMNQTQFAQQFKGTSYSTLIVSNSFQSSTLKMWICLSHKHANICEKLCGKTIYLMQEVIEVIKLYWLDSFALSPSKVCRDPFQLKMQIFCEEFAKTCIEPWSNCYSSTICSDLLSTVAITPEL